MRTASEMRSAADRAIEKRNECQAEAEKALDAGNTAMYRWYAQEAARYNDEVKALEYDIHISLA